MRERMNRNTRSTIHLRIFCHSSISFSSWIVSSLILPSPVLRFSRFPSLWPSHNLQPDLQVSQSERELSPAMSSAVCTPLPISSSLRCSATPAAESSSNGVTSSANSVKLPQQATQTLSLNAGGERPSSSAMAVLHPGMDFVNVMFFKGSYNTQVFVGEDEPADSVVRRFRKAVMQAGVIPECRRRRFHETPQDIVKRKQQNARRRKISNRRFTGPRPEGGFGEKKDTPKATDDDDDFWGYAEEGADANL